MKIWGKSVDGKKAFVVLTNAEICGCLQEPLLALSDGFNTQIESIPSEQVHTDINRYGFWVTGNSSQLEKIEVFMTEKTGKKFRRVRHHHPGLSVILGVKKMIDDKELLKRCDIERKRLRIVA